YNHPVIVVDHAVAIHILILDVTGLLEVFSSQVFFMGSPCTEMDKSKEGSHRLALPNDGGSGENIGPTGQGNDLVFIDGDVKVRGPGKITLRDVDTIQSKFDPFVFHASDIGSHCAISTAGGYWCT